MKIINNFLIKLFLSLLFILIALQVFFFADYYLSQEIEIHPERNRTLVMRIQMLKEEMENAIRSSNEFTQAEKELQDIISKAGELYGANIWIENSDGTPLLEFSQTQDGQAKVTEDFNIINRYDDVTISYILQNNLKFIDTEVPFDPQAGNGLKLHVRNESKLNFVKSKFKIRLAGIILFMTAFTLSLLQFIRIKVNRFKKSVLRIADGDLSHRVDIKGRGVVEDLGRAFNHMTDKLEQMIASNKEITANVSHEIRTPLARLRVLEALLRKKFGRGDFSEYKIDLDEIREDIQILDDLVGRLLEFVKLDSYESIPKHERFNPSELMNDLLIRFEPVIEFKELSIKKDLFFSAPFSGNKIALTSLFLNILDNAFKYSPEHGTITIKMHSEQGFFQTSIINSFEKMDQKDLDNIFKPFERIRQSECAGSGLGLAISKKIVENHGGNISALNSTEGFEMRIRLPL